MTRRTPFCQIFSFQGKRQRREDYFQLNPPLSICEWTRLARPVRVAERRQAFGPLVQASIDVIFPDSEHGDDPPVPTICYATPMDRRAVGFWEVGFCKSGVRRSVFHAVRGAASVCWLPEFRSRPRSGALVRGRVCIRQAEDSVRRAPGDGHHCAG